MLFYIYSDAPGSTIDITSRCRVDRPFSVKDNAEEGSVAISSLIIDDPAGDLIVTGHRRIYIYESDAPIGNQNVFNGFITNERVSRGPYRTGAGRQWTVDLADANVFLNRRIMNGTDANRPAETDLARIQALLTMTELNTVDDDLYVNTSAATTTMDAVDYRGQNVGAYVDDCRQASGKNAYIWFREATAQYSLWYDFATSTAYDSGCFLSNTLGDLNHSTVFGYSQERTYINFDPTRVASGIYLEYDGPDSPVYVQSATTLAHFAAIDWAAPSLNVKSLAKATARANRYLAGASTEDPIIHTVMTKVPRAKVNAVKKGQLVQFKATWGPGYESYTTCRVLWRQVTEISEDAQASFEIEMELSPVIAQCEGATASGYYPPIGGPTSDSFGNVIYWRAGGSVPEVPTPGFTSSGTWHFPDFMHVYPDAVNPLGWCDAGFADLTNSVRCIIVGSGTMTLYTHVDKGHTEALFYAALRYSDPVTSDDITVETQGPLAAGATVVFLVPDMPDVCTFWVDLSDEGLDNGGWSTAFDGFDWVPGA